MIGSLDLSEAVSDCCTGMLPLRLSSRLLGVRLGRIFSKKLGRRCRSLLFLGSGSITLMTPGAARILPMSDSLRRREPTVAASEACSTSFDRTKKRIIAAFDVGGWYRAEVFGGWGCEGPSTHGFITAPSFDIDSCVRGKYEFSTWLALTSIAAGGDSGSADSSSS